MRWRFTYRGQVFHCSPPDDAPPLRCEAFKTFLQHHPDISSERFSLPDFELLWYAAKTTLSTPADTSRAINCPPQKIDISSPRRTLRWNRQNIPMQHFFSEVFCFLERKYALTGINDIADPRNFLAQPCDLHVRTCTYAGATWYCIVSPLTTDFFDTTVTVLSHTCCFRQQLWSTADFTWMWRCIQQTCASGNTQVGLNLHYADRRWRRTVQAQQLISAAELVHFLHARPAMPFEAFLLCFDACLSQPASHWPFLCQTSSERRALLTAACETTAREPTSYSSDGSDMDLTSSAAGRQRRLRLVETASAWPAAIPPGELFSHMTTYRSYFYDALKPPFLCAACACSTSFPAAELLNLRDVFPDLMVLHSIFSAKTYLHRYYEYHGCNLPRTFSGLRMETLQSYLATLPTELRTLEPAPRQFLLRASFSMPSFFSLPRYNPQ